MLANYLKIALRNLRKHAAYTVINVTGLALGMACCLLMLLYIRDELSYDTYHEHADAIYRVTRAWYDADGEPTQQFARISAPIGPALKDEFPEIRHAARVLQWGSVVSYEDQHVDENRFFYAEPDLVDILTIPFVRGNPETALSEPNTLVLTESMAQKYFGSSDPMGKTLRFADTYDLRVTGVVEDPPPNTHFHYDVLASYATIATQSWMEPWASDWGSFNNLLTYVRLAEEADPSAVQARLPAFLDRHYTPHIGSSSSLDLQPVPDIHLHSHLDAEIEANGDITYVYLFGAIAFFVLLIACFNFMNLATARSTRRAKEVGLRKVLGAERKRLVGQFLGESVLMAFIALFFTVAMAEFAMPFFNDLTGKELSLLYADGWFVGVSLLGIALFVGLAAGSYPAFVLSSFRPASVLKGTMGRSGGSRFRTVLVVAQFAISIVLIVGVSVIYRQLDYVQDKRLGFDKEQLVVLPATDAIQQNFESVRNQLLTGPNVRAVTASQLVPSDQLVNSIDVSAEVDGSMKRFESLPLLPVDHAFTETYGIDVVAGRTFSTDRASDSTQAFVLNEAAVRQMGWSSPEDAIGATFVFHANAMEDRRGQVIGVVRDFHFESLHERITPLVMFIMPERYRHVTVKIAGGDVAGTLAFLEAQWQRYRPNFPFEYTFIDQNFAQLYRAEQRLGQVFGVFAVLAIFIACLGLFGLAAFTAEQRTKEIGVRKVLGASVSSIVLMLSKDFGTLIAGAFLVACPIAYVAMDRWLEQFAYHTSIGADIFLLAGVLTLVIALATVSYQSIRAALADPVKSLRYE